MVALRRGVVRLAGPRASQLAARSLARRGGVRTWVRRSVCGELWAPPRICGRCVRKKCRKRTSFCDRRIGTRSRLKRPFYRGRLRQLHSKVFLPKLLLVIDSFVAADTYTLHTLPLRHEAAVVCMAVSGWRDSMRQVRRGARQRPARVSISVCAESCWVANCDKVATAPTR